MKLKNWCANKWENFTGIVEFCDGIDSIDYISIHYYKNGKCHNENGPAREWTDGRDSGKFWYLNNRTYSEDTWKTAVENIRKYGMPLK